MKFIKKKQNLDELWLLYFVKPTVESHTSFSLIKGQIMTALKPITVEVNKLMPTDRSQLAAIVVAPTS